MDTCSSVDWETTIWHSPEEVFIELAKLRLHNTQWVFRGQSEPRPLCPNIDRFFNNAQFKNQSESEIRATKLNIERQIIERFRTAVKATVGDKQLIYQASTIVTLMVIQHHGGPTRLLDWSFSPYVATYFAVNNHYKDDEDGEIWAFDYNHYVEKGSNQWKNYPEVFKGGSFDGSLTIAFENDYLNNWIVCQFLNNPFPRMEAQEGLFTFCPQFGSNHAERLAFLLSDKEHFHRYVIKGCKDNKKVIRSYLRNQLGIWFGQIYPDLIGVSTGLMEIFKDEGFVENY